MKFRYYINYTGIGRNYSTLAYNTRHECAMACMEMIEWIKSHRPDLYAKYAGWRIHGES